MGMKTNGSEVDHTQFDQRHWRRRTLAFALAALSSSLAWAQASKSAAKEASSSNAAVQSGAIVIGISRPYTGALKGVAAGYAEMVKATFEQANAAGGIRGRALELLELDDEGLPEKTAENVRKLAQNQNVMALVGLAGTANVLAAWPAIEEAKLPLIGPFSGATGLRDAKYRQIFHVRASYDAELEALAQTIADRYAKGTTTVLYQDDAFGQGAYGTFLQAISAKAPQMKIQAHRFDRSTVAVQSEAEAIAHLRTTNAVLLIAAPKAAAKLLTQARGLNAQAAVYTLSVVDALNLVADAGVQAAAGMVITQVLPNPKRSQIKFAKDYRALAEKAQQGISYAGFEGYLVARALIEALQANKQVLSRERVIGAFEELGRFDLGGYSLDYSAGKRNGSRFVDLSIISRSGSIIE